MKNYFFTSLLIFSLLQCAPATAQKTSRKYKKGGTVELNDSLTNYSQSDIFNFPNMNRVPYYYNKAALEKIKVLNMTGKDPELYQALRAYVHNFGIENFYKDTDKIWQLAKLSEQYGAKGEAVLWYKIVLKHHRENIDGQQVRKEYDTLVKNEKDYYVPLKFYYELVALRREIDTLRPPQGVLLNMGISVNSPRPDYGPTIGNTDTVLLFTSKRNAHASAVERIYDEDLFFSIQEYGVWMDAQPFKGINTRYNEGSACLSRDGRHLYFARCNSPDSHGGCDIFVSDMKADSTWGNPYNLGTNINSSSWDSHPSLSHSGDTLFFASDRLDGFGLSDIYYSVRDEFGIWQKAKNLGPVVNTRGNEVSPFFHHKYNVLYFSSDGHPLNFGEFDIYKSYRDAYGWGEPKNVGPLVNGTESEYYFTIDAQSEHLYYAREVENEPGNFDLHSFPVPMEAKPDATARLSGSLKNSQTGKPFKGIVSIIDLEKGVEVAPKYLRPDGSFDFELINKRTYLLIIQGDDYFRIEEVFFMDGDMEINRETDPLESKIAFKSLEFENGKSDILPAMHADLDRLANFLIDHPRFTLYISGHTDSQGKEESNLRLSQSRADAIRSYLIYQFNIAPERIVAIGFGSSKPIIKIEESEEDRKLNRRVEFNIERSKN